MQEKVHVYFTDLAKKAYEMDLLKPTLKTAAQAACLLSLFACSGGGSDTGGIDNANSSNSTPDQFAKSLIRQSGDAELIPALWRCVNNDNVGIGLMVSDFSGTNKALSFTTPTTNEIANTAYDWQATGKNSFELTTETGGLHERFDYVNFSSARSMTVTSSLNGELSCSYLTESEIAEVTGLETTVGAILINEPMLPTLTPDGFVQLTSYFIEGTAPLTVFGPDLLVTYLGGSSGSTETKELYNDGLTPDASEDSFNGGRVSEDSHRYQFDGNTLSLGTPDGSGSLNEYPTFVLEPGRANERLDACVSTPTFDHRFPKVLPGLQFSSEYVRMCFYPNGRFTMQGGVDTEGAINQVFTPNVLNTGRYRLDGYALRVEFDYGYQRTIAFGWRNRADREVYILRNEFLTLDEPASLTGN